MLNPNDFITPFDNNPEYAQQQYQRGLSLAEEGYTEFHIAVNGVWSASKPDKEYPNGVIITGGSVFSYEKLGHHAHTADLLRGVIESGIEIVDHRGKDG